MIEPLPILGRIGRNAKRGIMFEATNFYEFDKIESRFNFDSVGLILFIFQLIFGDARTFIYMPI